MHARILVALLQPMQVHIKMSYIIRFVNYFILKGTLVRMIPNVKVFNMQSCIVYLVVAIKVVHAMP